MGENLLEVDVVHYTSLAKHFYVISYVHTSGLALQGTGDFLLEVLWRRHYTKRKTTKAGTSKVSPTLMKGRRGIHFGEHFGLHKEVSGPDQLLATHGALGVQLDSICLSACKVCNLLLAFSARPGTRTTGYAIMTATDREQPYDPEYGGTKGSCLMHN